MRIFLGSVQVLIERKSKLTVYRIDHYDPCKFECKSGLVGNSVWYDPKLAKCTYKYFDIE